MLTTIPFEGFYNSVHGDELDIALEQMFHDDDGVSNEGLVDRAYTACDWQAVHERYARAYAEKFSEMIEVNMTFESLQRPREYNFETDRILCTIEKRQVRKLFAAVVQSTEFADVCREHFQSRDGFVSFYSPDWRDWPKSIAEWDHNQVGAVVLAYTRTWNGGKDLDSLAEMGLMEDFLHGGHAEEWIYRATPGMGRLCRINGYLNERAKRSEA
jgi:hypothetical protein